jgi:OOP family OmpA-OmpF porin
MNKLVKTMCIVLFFLPIAACTSDLQSLKVTAPSGSAFSKGLAQGYQAFAEDEAREYDWRNSSFFAAKGLEAAKGAEPQPEVADGWHGVPEDMLPALHDARVRLMSLVYDGGRTKSPEDAAAAQVAYDCWVEEASEPNSEPEMSQCRDRLMALLDKLTPKAAAPAPPTPPQATPAAPLPQVYLVFFAFDKFDISPVAQRVLDKMIDDFHATGSARLDVQGHTDLAGSVEYNLKLSERRAEAVKRYLIAHGVKDTQIRTEWFGKSHPRVPTPDGMRNQDNRRAEIYLKK